MRSWPLLISCVKFFPIRGVGWDRVQEFLGSDVLDTYQSSLDLCLLIYKISALDPTSQTPSSPNMTDSLRSIVLPAVGENFLPRLLCDRGT